VVDVVIVAVKILSNIRVVWFVEVMHSRKLAVL
jgi:hypothetical protein